MLRQTDTLFSSSLLLPLLLLSALAGGCVTNGGWVEDPSTFQPGDSAEEPQPGSPEHVRQQSETQVVQESGAPAEPSSPSEPWAGEANSPNAAPGTPPLQLKAGEPAPVEIFVLPIQDESGAFGPPLVTLRQELADGLVERRYSPLSLCFGDQVLAEATAAGAIDPVDAIAPLDADALLQVRLGEWNTELLESRGILRASIELYLWRGDDPRSAALWTGRVERTVEVPARNLRSTPKAELEADCARRLVGQLLESLPPRT